METSTPLILSQHDQRVLQFRLLGLRSATSEVINLFNDFTELLLFTLVSSSSRNEERHATFHSFVDMRGHLRIRHDTAVRVRTISSGRSSR